MDCFHNGHEIRSILFPTLSFDTLTNYHLRLPSSTTIMLNFNVKNRRSLRRAGLMTAIAAPSLMSGLVRSQGTSGRAQLRITLTTSNRGSAVPRWVTRPVSRATILRTTVVTRIVQCCCSRSSTVPPAHSHAYIRVSTSAQDPRRRQATSDCSWPSRSLPPKLRLVRYALGARLPRLSSPICLTCQRLPAEIACPGDRRVQNGPEWLQVRLHDCMLRSS